jgi:glutathione-regulated potassium-efflux system ancillary protein KefC/glutathione-regulated potassium-efflux system protein KefB
MGFLNEALIFFVAALIVVPLCKRLGLSPVLGYLGAGLLIGPPGLALIGGAGDVLRFAEVGVALFLFLVGLELQPRRLWVMRRAVFGFGTLQLMLTTAVLGVLLAALALDGLVTIIVAFALALSSTAFVLQLLGEQRRLQQPHGRASFGVLLLQDIAVVPAMILIGFAAGRASDAGTVLNLPAAAIVVGGCVAARFLLRPALRWIAQSGIHELFTAAGLTLAIGAALAMHSVGLSMALGAFIAGLMVADSPYRHQLETDINPFKGLLLGLFFMAVGMSVDLALLRSAPLTVLGLTIALMAVKSALIYPLGRWHGLPPGESLRAALVLAQGGEFAFVLLSAAAAGALIDQSIAGYAVLVVTLSMALTPALVSLGERLLDRNDKTRPYDIVEGQDNAVVIAGFGRVGQIVARVLTMRHIPFTGLEIDPGRVDFMRRYGHRLYYGDATRLDLLKTAHVASARALIVAVGNMEASVRIVEQVRATCPGVAILARAVSRDHELRLREIGVDFVIRDTFLSSLALAIALLEKLGLSSAGAEIAVEQFRQHDIATLDRQFAVFRDDDAMHRTTLDAQEELKLLFSEDDAAGEEISPKRV